MGKIRKGHPTIRQTKKGKVYSTHDKKGSFKLGQSKFEIDKIIEKHKNWKPSKSKPAVKAVAKKTVGKTVGRFLPGVGAAILARDVIKGVSKATCGKRGGKWVSGKCVGTKKTKFKPGAKVRDPISKR